MGRNSAHQRAQKEGKERDLYTCQICGSKFKPEGHHMFDYSYGGSADPDNIVTLCHQCHVNVHNGLTSLFKF